MNNKLMLFSYIMSVFLLFGCKTNQDQHGHSHDANGGYGHQSEKMSYTVFSKGYELYVEFQPLIAGEICEFTAHIIELSDYKPVMKGLVTALMIKDDKGIKHKVNEPESPGIFNPSLQPKDTGLYSLNFVLTTESGDISFSIKSVNVFSNRDEAINSIKLNSKGDEISFSKERAWKADFAVKIVKKDNFNEVISTSGQILPAKGDETTVVAPFSGIVLFNNQLLPGREIEKGETLLLLSGKGLASDNITVHYIELKSNYEKAKANYKRLKELLKEKIVSEKEFIEARTEYEQAKIAFENASITSDGSVNKVLSSHDGFVKDLKVADGQFVKPGDPLVIITQNKRLILKADVSQNHWQCLPDIKEAHFITPYDSKFYKTRDLKGQLISYSRSATNTAWSAPVFFEINNTGNLMPGTYVEVFLFSKLKPNVIVIPKSALIEEQGNFFVFVQLSGESYEKRQVKTGINNGLEVEILSGLKDGEVIVTKGAYQVKLASISSALPAHRHVH